MNIKLRIEDRESWMRLYKDFKKNGMLSNIAMMDVSFDDSAFPIDIPVNVDNLMNLINNPVIKPFKKKINESLERTIGMVLN